MVFARPINKHRRINFSEVHFIASDSQCARIFEFVFKVGISQVPAKHRTWEIGTICIPVQEIKRRWSLTLEVIRLHIVPDQIVCTQTRECAGEITTWQQPSATDCL